MKTTRLAIATASLLLAAAAQAQTGPSGFTVGVAGGISKFNESCEGTTSCDTTDTATRLSLGYGLGNGLVVEGVSYGFGKLKGTASGASIEFKASAVGGGIAYHAPMGSSGSLFVRLGLAQVKTKVTARGFGITLNDSEDNSALYAGLGFAWNISSNIALELGWDTTQMKYDDEKMNVSAATIGVRFTF